MTFSTIFTKFQYFIFLLKKQSESQSESRQKVSQNAVKKPKKYSQKLGAERLKN